MRVPPISSHPVSTPSADAVPPPDEFEPADPPHQARSLPSEPPPERQRTRGGWQPDDALLLMTDALAQWFLRECEQGRRPWTLLDFEAASDFAGFVDELRNREELRNDDVTLLTIRAKGSLR